MELNFDPALSSEYTTKLTLLPLLAFIVFLRTDHQSNQVQSPTHPKKQVRCHTNWQLGYNLSIGNEV